MSDDEKVIGGRWKTLGLIAIQGKDGCRDPRCRRMGGPDGPCAGYHCPTCGEPCSMMGHKCPERGES